MGKLGWVMRPEAADGARDGGDIAGEVFRGKLETLVREILQNSKDAHRAKQRSVEVVFRFVELSGDHLTKFLTALAWKELEPHVAALAAKQPRAKEALAALKKGQLRVLVIEDQNTVGLRGPEDGAIASSPNQPKEFAALTKDRLFSEKGAAGAGGSYGLGKATLWAFSAFHTVLFNSRLSDLLEGQENPRLFGRAHLAWHEVGKKRFDGPGWFGLNQGARADSVMGAEAQERSTSLLIARSPRTTGTSILITAFDEPESEDRPLSEVADAVLEAVERWFWPSLDLMGDRGLRVRVQGYENDTCVFDRAVDSTGPYQHLRQMLTKYRAGELSTKLDNPGDVAMRSITIKLPKKKDGAHQALDAQAHLVVSLAEPEARRAEINTVAAFRRPGMVIDYDGGPDKRLGLGKRPFYAVLVCGAATTAPDALSRDAFDAFLRMAENPAHDAWVRWDRLRDHYGVPYQQPLLKDLPAAVVKALRELVVVEGGSGEDAPAKLMSRFRIGGGKGPGEPKVALERGAKAHRAADGTWTIDCAVVRSTNADKAWSAILDFRFATEDGGSGDGRLFATATSDTPGASVSVKDGVIVVRAKSVPPRKVKIHATTDPTRYPHPTISALTAVDLRVREGDE
ncbi:MAG: hypothetical protein M3Y87_09945 [Myxococcota bacterium]|nr:hypothetical protein [Myxococcota bacterium]